MLMAEVNVGLVWLCGEGGLKEDLGDSVAFHNFVVWSWSE
jgi:hypothetical protein